MPEETHKLPASDSHGSQQGLHGGRGVVRDHRIPSSPRTSVDPWSPALSAGAGTRPEPISTPAAPSCPYRTSGSLRPTGGQPLLTAGQRGAAAAGLPSSDTQEAALAPPLLTPTQPTL